MKFMAKYVFCHKSHFDNIDTLEKEFGTSDF